MATLIQSKQIQGVVTASVVIGDFQVSGSTNLTGSVGVQGTLTATSFTGDGSNLSFGGTNIVSGSSQVTISQTSGYTAFSSSIATSIASIVDSDAQTLSISGDQLSISNGNTITIPTGSGGGGASTWNELSGIPTGLISGSTFTDFSSSVDSRIDGISASGSGADWNTNLQNIPVGLVSGSTQITNGSGILSGSIESLLPSGVVSGSTQITNGSGIISGSVLRTLDGTGVISGSVLRTLDGTGVVSGSVLRTLDGTGVVSGSVLRTLDGTGVFSGSLVAGTNITINQVGDNFEISSSASGGSTPAGTISSSAQVISALPDGVVSGSSQITDGSGILSGSIESQLPAGIISGSAQITALGFVSESLTNLGGTNVLSSSTNFETYSSSVDSRIDTEKTRIDNILSGANADYDQFVEIVDLVNSTDTTNDIAFANHYTSSRQRLTSLENFTQSIDTSIKTKLNTDGVLSGSIESLLPSGTISGSTQITNGSGIVSGSVLRTLDGTGVFSGSLVAGSNITINQVGNNFEISSSASGGGGASVTVSDSAPNSPSEGDLWWKSNDGNLYVYYDSYWVISTDVTAGLPAGVVSGSAQITSVITDAYISASAASSGFGSGGGTSDFTQLTNVPSGLVSGSSQITNASGIVSGSVLRTLDGTGVISGSVLRPTGDGVVSGSVLRTLDGTGVFSGSLVAGTNVTINQNGNNFIISSSASGDSIPAGTISGSAQITALGFISESNFNGSGVVSGSVLRPNGDDVVSGSVVRTLDGTSVISGSAQITALGFISESAFDGNRIVSNTDLPSGVYNNNFGTSGSVQDFLNAVFFPNSAPSISTGNQTIQEFSGSSSTIVTLSGTDAEGQSLTWGTASAYTDDLVRVASNGVMTLNATATSASFNTDLISGTTYGHLVTVTATDTFAAETEKDIYIIVTPNEAPKFRETSIAGNVITSVTQAVNENSSDNTLIKRIYFTDSEGDSITITSSSISPSDHFSITKSSTYVDIRQNTGSLDYENITQYTFSITASDEHYPAQDSNAVTTLPITINVTDNIVPSISNQTISGLNENSSNGASAGTISASDNEGDSITFVSFDLHKLLLDGSTVTSGSYGGTSQLTDPHENPFQMDSSGNVTRKTGVYLNSDIINSYQYRVKVKDNYNATNSTPGIVSIPVTDDTAPTISTNGTFRIVESATSGDLVRTSSNGYSGTQARLTSNQSVTWSDDSGMISINGSGYISLSSNVDGVYTSGQSFTANVTATNSFGTTTTQSITINVVANGAPTISFTNQTANFETDLALSGVTMVSMSVTDQESDTPYSASLTGTDASSFRLVYTNANSSSIGLQATSNLSVGTYSYNIKVTDNYNKSTTYSGRSITIATSADYGKTYIYRSNFGTPSDANYQALMGASSVSGDTPPEVTGYTANASSPFRLISSSLGDSTLTLASGNATLVATLSGSDLDTIISESNPYTMGATGEQYFIVVPSGSDMTGIPSVMVDTLGGSTVGEYNFAIKADGGSWGEESSKIHLLDTSGSFNGYDKHFVIGRTGQNAATSVSIRILPASGSLPS